MSKPALRVLAFLVLLVHPSLHGPAAAGQAAEAPTGLWTGAVEIAGRRSAATLNLSRAASGPAGTIDFLFENESGLELRDLAFDSSGLRFVVSRRDSDWVFACRESAGVLEGTVRSGVSPGTARFAAVAEMDPAGFDALAGAYRISPERVVSIAPYRGEKGCPWPVSVDFSTGNLRALFPTGPDRFVAGPSFLVPSPPEVTVEFERDPGGTVSALHWREPDGNVRRAPRIVYPREEVRIVNGEVTLAGTLSLPSTPGPHPAIVFAHGSGPQPRDHAVFSWLADYFVLHGYAVLGYDKRGVGGSGGDWRNAPLEDLAGDALAAVSLLRSRPDIRGDAVGILGISQGGWICTIAAARSRDVGFIVMISGAGVGVAQQDVDRIERTLRTSGFTGEEALAAAAHQRLFYDTLEGRATWEQFEASLARAREARWADQVALPTRERFEQRAPILRRFFGYDPAEDFARVTCPVLALFGGRDIIVPPDRNVAPMERGFAKGRADLTVRVFPTGDHVLDETETGAMGEIPFIRRVVPGYLDAVVAWLRGKVG